MQASMDSAADDDRSIFINHPEQLDDEQSLPVPPSPFVHPILDIAGHSPPSPSFHPDRAFDQAIERDPLPPAYGELPIHRPDPYAQSHSWTDFGEEPSPHGSLPDSNYDSLADGVDEADDAAAMMGLVILAIVERTMASPAYQIFGAPPTSSRLLSRCPRRRATNPCTRTG